MNLLIIDDEQIVREGLKTIFPWAEYGFTVCGEAKNGEEGVSLIRSLNPDLVLLDIKTIDAGLHPRLTAVKLDNTLRFLDELEKRDIPVWVRHVVVPGLTDNDEDLEKLAGYVSRYKVIQKAELLPYHTMGTYKYEAQGLDYKLKGVEPLSAERLANAKTIFRKHGINV